MTVFRLLNPCWICSSIAYLFIAFLVFCFFGYAGKVTVFARKHDLGKFESLGVSSFWYMDLLFWAFGAIFSIILVWALYVIRFLYDLIFNPAEKKKKDKRQLILEALGLFEEEKRSKQKQRATELAEVTTT
jgi:hypothetical protein